MRSDTSVPRLPAMAVPRLSPLPRRPTSLPTGPRIYRETKRNTIYIGGPGLPPPGFKFARNSASEWPWYWASMRVLDPDRNPRLPPFYGGESWKYQTQELPLFAGDFGRARSTNVDFLYLLSFPPLAIRIQTYRFHQDVPSLKQEYDNRQLLALLGYFDTIDVYEGDFLADRTGGAAIQMVRRVLGLEQTTSPLRAGTTYLVRNPITG